MIPEKHELLSAQNRHRGVLLRDVHQEPVVGRRRRPGQHGIDDVERGEVHNPGLRAHRRADALVLLHDVPARHDHQEFRGAIGGLHAGHVAQLRVVYAEGDRLPHLPADELREVGRPRRHLLKLEERHFRHAVRNGQRDPPGPHADAVEHAPQRLAHHMRIDDVRGVQQRRHGARRQRLHRMRRYGQPRIAHHDGGGRDAMLRNLNGHRGQRGGEDGPGHYSTNVTLVDLARGS